MNERRLYVIVITASWIISSLSSIIMLSAIFMANWKNGHLLEVLEGLEVSLATVRQSQGYSSSLLGHFCPGSLVSFVFNISDYLVLIFRKISPTQSTTVHFT